MRIFLFVGCSLLLIFAGQPLDFPSEEGAHFASNAEKLKAAVRHGAVGFLVIHTPRAAERYQWDRVRSLVGTPSMGWINEKGGVHGEFEQIQATGMLRHTAATRLFENTPVDLKTLIERDETGVALTGFNLEGKVSMRQRSTHDTIYSPNVVAILPGSDPLLADEHVLYTAHLDHIGELHSDSQVEGEGGLKSGDSGHKDLINNGAMDNTSGISVMLETARLLTEGEAPRRSIVFHG